MNHTDEDHERKPMSAKHLRRTIYWLALDWIHLHKLLPTPPRADGRRTTTREYGHPAEWASDRAAEIVDKLTSWHDCLAEGRNETPPTKGIIFGSQGIQSQTATIGIGPATFQAHSPAAPKFQTATRAPISEQRRLITAYRYLEPRCEQLTQIAEPEALQELPELHNKIRKALGQTKPQYTLPVPCPNNECQLLTLTRIVGVGQDFICCDACGYTIKEIHYPFLIRMTLDAILNNADENSDCTGTVAAGSTTVPDSPT